MMPLELYFKPHDLQSMHNNESTNSVNKKNTESGDSLIVSAINALQMWSMSITSLA